MTDLFLLQLLLYCPIVIILLYVVLYYMTLQKSYISIENIYMKMFIYIYCYIVIYVVIYCYVIILLYVVLYYIRHCKNLIFQ